MFVYFGGDLLNSVRYASTSGDAMRHVLVILAMRLFPIVLALAVVVDRSRLASGCCGPARRRHGRVSRTEVVTIAVRGLGLYLLLGNVLDLADVRSGMWMRHSPLLGPSWWYLFQLGPGLLLAWPTGWVVRRLQNMTDIWHRRLSGRSRL